MSLRFQDRKSKQPTEKELIESSRDAAMDMARSVPKDFAEIADTRLKDDLILNMGPKIESDTAVKIAAKTAQLQADREHYNSIELGRILLNLAFSNH